MENLRVCRICTLSLKVSLLVICSSFGSYQASSTPVERALDHLAELAAANESVQLSVRGFSVSGAQSSQVAETNPFRSLLAMNAEGVEGFRILQSASWRRGQIAGVSSGWTTSERMDVMEQAFYWAGNRGLKLDFVGYSVSLHEQFMGLDGQFMPQELRGFYSVMPLAAMAAHARGCGTLQVLSSNNGVATIRFPVNLTLADNILKGQEPELTPYFDLTFDFGEETRLVKQEYYIQHYGVIEGFEVTEWTSRPGRCSFPARVRYFERLAPYEGIGDDRRIVFDIVLDSEVSSSVDGQSVLDLIAAVGFLTDGIGFFASDRGAQVVAERAAASLREHVGEEPVDGAGGRASKQTAIAESHTDGADRIRESGAFWPPLTQVVVDRQIERLNLLDLKGQYCGQMGVTVIFELSSIETTFGGVRATNPEQLMSLASVRDLLGSRGLDYEVVRTGEIEKLMLDESPFLVIQGQDPEAGHVGVARKRMSDGTVLLWQSPNSTSLVPKGNVAGVSKQELYIVPKAWLKGTEATWERAIVGLVSFMFIGLFLGLVLLVARKWKGGVAPVDASAALLFVVAAIGLSSCDERVDAGGPRAPKALASAVPETLSVDVELSEAKRFTIEIANMHSSEIRIGTPSVSCSCISYAGRDSYLVPVGDKVVLPFNATGAAPGVTQRTISVMVLSGAGSQLISVPVTVTCRGAPFLEPTIGTVVGKAGEEMEGEFAVCALLEPGEEVRSVVWKTRPHEMEFLKQRITVEEAYGGRLCKLWYRCKVPNLKPGSYVVSASAFVDLGDRVVTLSKNVALSVVAE